jgi:hypothetical protein
MTPPVDTSTNKEDSSANSTAPVVGLPDTVLTKVLEAAMTTDDASSPGASTSMPKPKGSFRKAPKKGAQPTQGEGEVIIDAISQKLDASSLSAPSEPNSVSATASDVATAAAPLTFSGRSLEGSLGSDKLRPEECCEQVYRFLHSAVAPMPNPATVATPHANADLLYLLDKISQDVMKAIIAHQNADTSLSNPLVFREYDRVLELHRIVSMAELQRHRRHFIKVNTQIPPRNEIVIGAAFIDFLALQL